MSKFLRRLLPMLAVLFFCEVQAQNFWNQISPSSSLISGEKSFIKPTEFKAFTLDSAGIKNYLAKAPLEFTAEAQINPLILAIPLPNGKLGRFKVVYSPVMEKGLSDKYPDMRTYSGVGIDDPTAVVRFDYTANGFHAMIRSTDHGQLFVDPAVLGSTTEYIVYDRTSLPLKFREADEVLPAQGNPQGYAGRGQSGPCLGSTLRTYRLAVATTGEYTTWYGGATNALAAVVTTVNRVNVIYEQDLSVRLLLVANNNLIIYPDATTDPFSSASVSSSMLTENQTAINNAIGSGSYDVGHVISRAGGGGLAQLGVVCQPGSKARGGTALPAPIGDAYDIDYVAHELGHQFGGNHTFNAVSSTNCTGGFSGTINLPTAVEPGSGVTIMGYAGICAPNNLADHSIPYFHAKSQEEIATYLSGTSCAVNQSTGNSIPVVNAGADYIIPIGTPFMLTGSATDANNSEVLTYSWEEMDAGSGSSSAGTKPYFRSFVPTISPTRYFPRMQQLVANGTGGTISETLPLNNETLNFRLTVRDNRSGSGGFCADDVVVTVSSAGGPFDVTSQWETNPAPAIWTAGSNVTVSWNPASTTNAPFNCANVTILFSADGGLTWPYTLVASTPNAAGSATFTAPNIKTTNGKVMVKAIGNIFFDINDGNITVNSPCSAVGATITPSATVTAQAGNSALNLGLSPTYGSFVAAGTITSSDPYGYNPSTNTGGLALLNGASCQSFPQNQYQYHSYTFSVTATGSYTFTFASTANLFVANLYNTSFNSTSPCTNFITSNTTSAGNWFQSLSGTLTAGNTYVLTIGTFTNNDPLLPASYKINITTATGGRAYLIGEQYTNPGASFTYGYVVVRNSTGNIVAISSSANLTNSTTYPAGQYTVYGISYSNAIAANLNTYVGGSFNALATQIQNNPNTFCADLSKNAVTVNVTGTFPVQFTALKARKQGEKVALDWGTVTEQNSSHFLVQRSANGSDFDTQIGNVKAAGNSNSQLNYNFVDASPLKSWNYYRIKQVDLDGKFSYSNVAAVNFENGAGLLLIYPNPAKDQLNVEYTTTRGGKLEMQVIDSKGAVLMSQKVSVSTGKNLETLNISSLAQGMYILKYIDTEGNISYTKFIKQ
jgi:hypothetical protein